MPHQMAWVLVEPWRGILLLPGRIVDRSASRPTAVPSRSGPTQRRLGSAGVVNAGLQKGSATDLPFGDAGFDVAFFVAVLGEIPDPDACLDELHRHVEWVRDFHAALEPHSDGVYVNFTSDDTPGRIREAAYGLEKGKHLVALKDEYDPSNYFRFNTNVPRRELTDLRWH